MEKSLKKGTAKEKVQKTISGWFGGIVKNIDNDKILEENKRKKVERDGAVDMMQQVQKKQRVALFSTLLDMEATPSIRGQVDFVLRAMVAAVAMRV